ncbi:hypothetical protein Vretifemale_4596 [Volvox reticuliferus]|uniref:Uncharacterized protein n=1 Tax=Volvox reticuliferus TaxID=1737510 RepID=A0A8J4FH10_9CHLO|nr:hypothetical protein Vretifemale_4596 [Volvox reticuliferus]
MPDALHSSQTEPHTSGLPTSFPMDGPFPAWTSHNRITSPPDISYIYPSPSVTQLIPSVLMHYYQSIFPFVALRDFVRYLVFQSSSPSRLTACVPKQRYPSNPRHSSPASPRLSDAS